MPGFLMPVTTALQCMHQAPVKTVPTQPRVTILGQPVATALNVLTVMGCLFTVPGPKPQPCMTIKWTMLSTRILINGQPALLQPTPTGPGAGVCQMTGMAPQVPPGPPVVTFVQTRVSGM